MIDVVTKDEKEERELSKKEEDRRAQNRLRKGKGRQRACAAEHSRPTAQHRPVEQGPLAICSHEPVDEKLKGRAQAYPVDTTDARARAREQQTRRDCRTTNISTQSMIRRTNARQQTGTGSDDEQREDAT